MLTNPLLWTRIRVGYSNGTGGEWLYWSMLQFCERCLSRTICHHIGQCSHAD